MFGQGVSVTDLFLLLNAIRSNNLKLEVKILEEPWAEFNSEVLKEIIKAINDKKIKNGEEIRLRLHG
jgi:hypothetical protein